MKKHALFIQEGAPSYRISVCRMVGGLAQYFTGKGMDTTQLIGIGAGILTSFSMLPQLIKIVREKKADEVSLLMILVLLAGLSLWTIYGIMKEDWPIIITNSFSVAVNILLLIFRTKYK